MDSATRIVPLDLVRPGPFSKRSAGVFPADRDGLVRSVREKGVLQPILVRPLSGDTYEIVAGERRWRAARAVGLTDIPVLIRAMSDGEAMQLGIIENVQRDDLNPLEEAAAYHELVERFGYTQERLAQEVGKTQGHISNTIRLLRLPDSVKAMVHDGKLAAGHARALLAMPDVEAAALRVVSEQMTVREVEAASRREAAPKDAAPPRAPRDAGPAAFRLGDGRMLKSLPVCEIAATLRLGELELRVLRAVQRHIGVPGDKQACVSDLIGDQELGRLISQAKGDQAA